MKLWIIKFARFIFRAWAIFMAFGAVVGIFQGEFAMAAALIFSSILAWVVTAKVPQETQDQPSKRRQNGKNIKVDCSLHITYEDGEGAVTERDIHIFSYEPKSKYIQARDSIARANRTFRVDRIQEAIDLESG